MQNNPKHQFHLFLKRHEIIYACSHGRTWLQGCYFLYRYKTEEIIIGTPHYNRVTLRIPFCEPTALYKKYLQFTHTISSLQRVQSTQLLKSLEARISINRPDHSNHPQIIRLQSTAQ